MKKWEFSLFMFFMVTWLECTITWLWQWAPYNCQALVKICIIMLVKNVFAFLILVLSFSFQAFSRVPVTWHISRILMSKNYSFLTKEDSQLLTFWKITVSKKEVSVKILNYRKENLCLNIGGFFFFSSIHYMVKTFIELFVIDFYQLSESWLVWITVDKLFAGRSYSLLKT